MKPLLQLNSVTKSFGAVRALTGVSFDLRAGEVHALLGENGAGKSTLIKVITGAHPADDGSMEIDGRPVPHLTPAAAHRLGVACIYQQPALFPDLTVAENIGLRLEPVRPFTRVPWAARRQTAAQLLDRIGAGMPTDAPVRSLSMPEQQLVEIACAIGSGARIVIMDEPTASLTRTEVELLFNVVRDLRAGGAGVIYISHRLDEIFALADRVTVLRDGESVGTRPVGGSRTDEAGLPEDSPDRAPPGRDPDRPASATALSEAELIQLMVGRAVSQIYPAPEGRAGEVVLSLEKLGSAEGGVQDLSLEVRAGEIVGLAGLVGAGRTELARVLFGITPADTGTLRLDGLPITVSSPREAVRRGIAYVPEDRRRHGVILELPIAANVTMAIHPQLFPGGWLRPAAEDSLTLDYLRELAVKAPGPATPGASLSGGNQQKIALARWLATRPRVLILDEPTQGVDIGAKAEIHRIIRQLAAQGLAVIMISSDLPEVIGMSDRIAVMRGGTITTVLPGRSDAREVMAAALAQPAEIPGPPDTKTPAPRGTREPPASGTARRPVTGDRRSAPVFPGRHFREWSVAAALFVLLLLLAIFAPNFYDPQPLLSRLTAAAPRLVLACGVALVIICRQIDISIGSLFAVSGTCAGLAAAAGLPVPAALLLAIGAGSLGGALNGVLVAGLRLPSIVVTLATMVTLREALRLAQQGVFINLPEGAQWFGLTMTAGQWTVCAIAVGLLIALAFGLRHLGAGRHLYAVGSDAEAARLAGIRPRWVTFGVFMFMGTLAGLAAVLNLVQSPQVDPNSGRGLELEAIAAAVVGGVAISGGRGSMWGVLTGLLLLVCIGPALTYAGVKPYWEKAIQGGIILLAVVADGARRRRDDR